MPYKKEAGDGPGLIRILHLQAVDAVGGAERTNFTVLTGMDRARFANEICILGAAGPYRSAYAAHSVPAHYLNHKPAKLAAVLRGGNYDFLLMYGLKANLLGRLLGPIFSRAIRVEVRQGMEIGRGRAARVLDQCTAGLVHYFISNSRAAARLMVQSEGKWPDRITVIPNGIAGARYECRRDPPAGRPLRLITVANLLPYKGHRYLLEAIRELEREGVACTLSVVGEGPERRALERLAGELAPGSVHFLGSRSDVPELLARADLLVHPSLTEGLPNAVMEAMAAGLPVVATDAGGTGELVLHEETGLLVPAGSAGALRDALRRLAAGGGLRARFGQNGRARILHHFPVRRMTAAFEDFCVQRRPPARPDILYITTTGMAVRYLVRDKLEALRAAGYRIRVLCGEDPYTARLAEEGLSIDTLKLSRFVRPLGDCGALIRLVRYLRRLRPRIVHSSTPKAGLLAPIAARLAGIPAVHTVAGLMFHDRAFRQENFLYRPAERLTAACSSYLLFQSREDLERIRNLGWKHPERLVYLGNGVDTERFNPDLYRSERSAIRREWGYRDDQFVVGIVARLLRSKGLGEFLEIANRLSGLPQLRFLVVGPVEANHAGAISDELALRAVEAGNVRFLGERQDMPRVYAGMDLFVLPSYREGVARALMEASAMELPVISSDIRGCREVVEEGRTGWLVPVRNRDALAERILECWRSPARARQFGRAGRERIQLHFNAQTVTSRLLQFYEQLLGRPARTAASTVFGCEASLPCHSERSEESAVFMKLGEKQIPRSARDDSRTGVSWV